ncbi:translesion error-prone DNA polymerase V autoproteolytic subunit [Erwinia tracheiphila]|uniref:SamA n=1 Tax=Erwinia tracheiphila TaxID=65700 RepID=A0A345CTZ2_9GAMM|nr:translesion error-prone DNA polymerase V autoproteolytic subunit [Erwinia tracheiphila]AXF76909.1 SamA [Erwinia tracheiphila]UIA84410.1 translesion error-prone DNA polymerase V autoproteolytic subunit [Erwinia tracheiphila]UIA92990.1 translesion error-prone DNA polymerase V autoproteolytic subunit [Erwinia tracheiphila]
MAFVSVTHLRKVTEETLPGLRDIVTIQGLLVLNCRLAELPFFRDGVSCGFPSPAQDYVEKRLSLDDFCVRYPESTYLVRAEGDSMQNVGIRNGDLLVVECIRQARHGDIVIAAVDGEFTCKRLQLMPYPALVPANPAFATIPLTEDVDTVVFGVVQHVVHSFDMKKA